VYRVAAADVPAEMATLDHREQGGYDRLDTTAQLAGGAAVACVVYIARPDNPNYVGPAPLSEIAHIVRRSRGPSGDNREYVLKLATALAEMGVRDSHIDALAALVAADEPSQSEPGATAPAVDDAPTAQSEQTAPAGTPERA